MTNVAAWPRFHPVHPAAGISPSLCHHPTTTWACISQPSFRSSHLSRSRPLAPACPPAPSALVIAQVKGSAGLWTVVPDDQLDKVVLTPSQRRLSASSKSNGGRWGRGRSQSSPETTAPGLAGQALLGKPSPQQSTAFADVAKRPRGDRLTGVTGGMVGTSTSTSLQQQKKIQQLKATVFRIQPIDRRSDKPARMAPGMAPTGGYDDAATTPAHPGPDGRELPSLLIANALLELATYL